MLLLPPATLTPEAFGELLVGSSTGQLVPLASVATIRETEGPAVINREALAAARAGRGQRARARSGQLRQRARAKVAQAVTLPEGVTVEWGGQFENFTRASQRLGYVAPIALAVIFAMLFLMFGDLRYAVAVFVERSARAGGRRVGAVGARPAVLDPGGGRLHRRGGRGGAERRGHGRRAGPPPRAVGGRLDTEIRARGAGTVFRPVVTTALVAALGLHPDGLSTHAGAEVQRPLATVVIGGILSSTLLGLLVLPVTLAPLRLPAPARARPRREVGDFAFREGRPRRTQHPRNQVGGLRRQPEKGPEPRARWPRQSAPHVAPTRAREARHRSNRDLRVYQGSTLARPRIGAAPTSPAVSPSCHLSPRMSRLSAGAGLDSADVGVAGAGLDSADVGLAGGVFGRGGCDEGWGWRAGRDRRCCAGGAAGRGLLPGGCCKMKASPRSVGREKSRNVSARGSSIQV